MYNTFVNNFLKNISVKISIDNSSSVSILYTKRGNYETDNLYTSTGYADLRFR